MPELPTLTHQPALVSPPTRELPPLVTQAVPHTRTSRPSSKLADWFSGQSDPITFALIPSPTKEKPEPFEAMTSPNNEQTRAHTEKQSATWISSKPPITSRFSFFGSKPTPPKAQIATSDLHDEWHDLDVKSALNPTGSADPFSPAAFKNLQQNAEGLLLKLQAAYKQRSTALHDVLAEKEAQAEELEGAEMRTKHLKLQLDGMTARLEEQDKAMMDLVDQLAQERQTRREFEDARGDKANRSPVAAVCDDQESRSQDAQHGERTWNSRTSVASDLSVESDGSCAESLFSRHGATSPAMSMSSVSTVNSPETQQYQMPAQISQRHPQVSETSAPFSASRLLGISAKSSKRDPPASQTTAKCANCSRFGGDSEAWSLVSMLKLENQGLKTRLVQLESTVDDCLDMVKSLF
ncbi:MAG: hypothetical protein LQ338_003990 [Usnochroma carphineum]|nr:MAG: hypothetical protein LQ338_003990 [Usnochroma carphineum]